jgi:hypothetical protein
MPDDALRYPCGTRPKLRDRVTLATGIKGRVAVIIENGGAAAVPGYDAETWIKWGTGLLIDADAKGLLFVGHPIDGVVVGWPP